MNTTEVLPARTAMTARRLRSRPEQEEVRVVVRAADLGDARDRELLRRIGLGDEDAFRSLFGRCAPTAKALALRFLRQPFLTDETVQEAFFALWRHPERYDAGRGSVRRG